jgi:septum site-determining protein MinD
MESRVIVVTSGKGGVGKTTTTANLAVALAGMGNRVVAIDGDVGLRNLDVIMGLENRIVYTLIDALEGICRLKQTLIKDKRRENLSMIPTAQSKTKDAVTAEQMVSVCNELRADFDYILVDSPAGIEAGFRNAAAGADEALVITTPEVSAVRDADRIIGLLESMEKSPIRLIVNRIKPHMV